MKGFARDLLVLAVVFVVLLGGLRLLTGSWPPAVIVESGSMMHADSEVTFGRIGTIDPGDLVFVKDVDSIDDVTTLVEGGRDRYGMPGDVIVYYKAGDLTQTPIIHRALAYVDVQGSGDARTYDVRWSEAACEGGATKLERDGRAWCRYGPEGIVLPVTGRASPYQPPSDGFITKGDNPRTNTQTDQASGLSRDRSGTPVPVPIEWVEGKGRGEVPWLGLLKLALGKSPNEDAPPRAWKHVCVPLVSCPRGGAYAPLDLWIMLGVTLGVVLVGPPLVDRWRARRAKAKDPQ